MILKKGRNKKLKVDVSVSKWNKFTFIINFLFVKLYNVETQSLHAI